MVRSDPELSWLLEREKPGSAGFLTISTRTYLLPNGHRSEWDILCGGDTVAILALTDDDRVVLVEQFRPGPGRILLELPGGNVEAGEDICAAARRELEEETGYTATSIEHVGQTWLASYATHRRHALVARGCRPTGAPNRDSEELCRPVVLGLDEFRRHLVTGQLTDADVAYMALNRLDSAVPRGSQSQPSSQYASSAERSASTSSGGSST